MSETPRSRKGLPFFSCSETSPPPRGRHGFPHCRQILRRGQYGPYLLLFLVDQRAEPAVIDAAPGLGNGKGIFGLLPGRLRQTRRPGKIPHPEVQKRKGNCTKDEKHRRPAMDAAAVRTLPGEGASGKMLSHDPPAFRNDKNFDSYFPLFEGDRRFALTFLKSFCILMPCP